MTSFMTYLSGSTSSPTRSPGEGSGNTPSFSVEALLPAPLVVVAVREEVNVVVVAMPMGTALRPAGIEEDAEATKRGTGGEAVAELPSALAPAPAAAGGDGTAKSCPRGCFGWTWRLKFVIGNCRDVLGDICDISDRSCCCFWYWYTWDCCCCCCCMDWGSEVCTHPPLHPPTPQPEQ